MEKVQAIMYIVFASVGVLAYIITTVLAIKRKKAKGEPVDITTVFDDIAGKVLTLVKEAERNFATVQSGGKMKLKDVLNDVKDLCSTAGVAFDKTYWTNYIGKAVELINIDRKSEETSEQTAAVSTDANKTI